MNAVHAFPLTPEMEARRARAEIVAAAYAILESNLPHDRATLREAAIQLMTWGDETDWTEGYRVMRLLSPLEPPPYSAGTGMIRTVLAGAFTAVVIGWGALFVMLIP